MNLRTLCARAMERWETRLAARDTNRVVRPFEWGVDWLGIAVSNGHPGADLARFVENAVAHSDEFYRYQTPEWFRLDGSTLSFPSPLRSPYEVNNLVFAEYFPAPNHRGRAVLVVPQWNSGEGSHLGLCRLLVRSGLSALRLSPAYHHRRKPPEIARADYHVSSNLGRTIHATRQSVLDARASLDWLQTQGYKRLALLGTSLGSCICLLAAAHDPRVSAGVFNHVSMYFSDVVWTGLSCRHIQKALHPAMSQEDLRRYWAVISPAAYLDRLVASGLRSLLVWASYDSTFLPEYSLQVLDGFRRRNLSHEAVRLPCGHYTSGKFPFSWWDGFVMSRFLTRHL